MWTIMDTGMASAEANMRLDNELLKHLRSSREAILRLYSWEGDCATYGHFIDPKKYLNLEEAKKMNLRLARRPTGGGLVFHLSDLAFSVLVPARHQFFSENTMENYEFVNKLVIRAIRKFLGENSQVDLLPSCMPASVPEAKHFCMAKATKYDVIVDGRKVGGAAQRKTRDGFLHQGTISIALPPDDYLARVLPSDSPILALMKENTFSLMEGSWTALQLFKVRKDLRKLLRESVLEG